MDEKILVPFETAKKLKKAGFDYPCSYYYTDENAPKGYIWRTQSGKPVNFNVNDDIRPIRCSAPTLWHTQKWLREKHNIHIHVEAVFGKRWTYTLIDTSPQTDMYGNVKYRTLGRDSFPDKDAYETVLSAAIDAALELITNKINFEPLKPQLLLRLHHLAKKQNKAMTQEEYHTHLISIEREYNNKILLLKRKYAMSNNPYKVGDIIQDNVGKLRIDRIGFTSNSFTEPSCVYYGVYINEDGTPCKRQINRPILQSNILKSNKEENV